VKTLYLCNHKIADHLEKNKNLAKMFFSNTELMMTRLILFIILIGAYVEQKLNLHCMNSC
jgi:hypothetical protein